MLQRLKALVQSIRDAFSRSAPGLGGQAAETARQGTQRTLSRLGAARGPLLLLGILGAAGYLVYRNPPLQTVGRGEVGVRANLFNGEVSEWRDGGVFVLPGLHQFRVYSLRDQTYRPGQSARADGPAPMQSLEGLSLGVDISVRYALDPAKLRELSSRLPDNVGGEIVEPAVQDVIYRIFARYTVREIFSTKRSEIQQAIEAELKAKLAADGIALRGVQIGKVDLPADYRRGMEALLAEEIASEKMRYTLELKEKRVRETALEGEADKVRREKSAEAAAKAVAENADIVIGVKVRMSQNVVARHGLEPLKRAIKARELSGVPAKVMCHIGGVESVELMSQILDLLRPGDVLTHCYSGAPNDAGQFTNIVQQGKVLPAALAAKQRGVVFDVGHGGGSFDYTVAEAAIAQGCPPDTLSSDIHVFSSNSPGKPYLTWVMSKFLNMGFTLEQVVAMATANPAKVINRMPKLGTLQIGAPADATLLDVVQGPVEFVDTRNNKRQGKVHLLPTNTVVAGVAFGRPYQAPFSSR